MILNQKNVQTLVGLNTNRIAQHDKAIAGLLQLLDATSAAVLEICKKDTALSQHAETIERLRKNFVQSE